MGKLVVRERRKGRGWGELGGLGTEVVRAGRATRGEDGSWINVFSDGSRSCWACLAVGDAPSVLV